MAEIGKKSVTVKAGAGAGSIVLKEKTIFVETTSQMVGVMVR